MKTTKVSLTVNDLQMIIDDTKESISLWQRVKNETNAKRKPPKELSDADLEQIVLCDKEIKRRINLIKTLSEHWRAIL